jgi:outer membrane immunogenic protein
VGGAVDPNFGTNDSDGIFGFHAGAQWQWGAWVLGVEAALSGCFKECEAKTGTLSAAAGFLPPNNVAQHKLTNLFTVGPRLGYAWDRWMIFATGGPGSFGNGASRNDGWYVGGGFDYMVHKGPLVDVILGLEYQHYDVSSKTAFCATACNPLTIADYDLNAKGDLVRARLTIKTQGYGFFYR